MAAYGGGGGGGGTRIVGDYIFGRMIGRGSFSDVWLARHRVRGTEVAVKEIPMERLSKKLRESLLSEIVILKEIEHPNIIALYDIIEYPKTIYIVLEYCRGGDLSMYIQRHGRVPEATAKYFMRQLANGLQVLQERNLIHRDLKPQNLLLSSNDADATLKIADFGFARPLQPRGLAETLCGSPLYMAPEIMQMQKYDAKADLWSIGVILFQLVTGKTPFNGNSQIELLQNIVKATELHFPPDCNDLSVDCVDLCQTLLRRNPVARLTFEEFFTHRFLSDRPQLHEAPRTSQPLAEPSRASNESSQEECLPFLFDEEPSVQEGSSAMVKRGSSAQCAAATRQGVLSPPAAKNDAKYHSSAKAAAGSRTPRFGDSSSNNMVALSRCASGHRPETPASGTTFSSSPLARSSKEVRSPMQQSPGRLTSKDPVTAESIELIDQDYVLVSGPPMEASSSSVSASRTCNSPCTSQVSPVASTSSRPCALSAPIKITGAAVNKACTAASLDSPDTPSVTSQGSTDMVDAMEQPSSHCQTRIRSLQQCAAAVSDLVEGKVRERSYLEAFSIQLVVLAIWKQALHVCHAQAASALEAGPSSGEIRDRDGGANRKDASGSEELISALPLHLSEISSQIERAFLHEVSRADELARELGPLDEATEMPDAMEMVFQAALAFGRNGAVDELMESMENAAAAYSKAVRLLVFLLVEAPSLILNPPFSLTNSDRFRLRSYIDVLSSRQGQSRSARISLLKCEDQGSP